MLSLRKINPTDKPKLMELIGNSEVSKYMSDRVPYPYTEQNADSFFEVVKNTPNDLFFAIDLNGEFIGGLGLHRQTLNHSKSVELGYWLGHSYWGKGYASAIIKPALEIAFSIPEITKVFARVFEGNEASEKVLLKNGFTLEGTLRKHITKNNIQLDEKIFGLLKHEFSNK